MCLWVFVFGFCPSNARASRRGHPRGKVEGGGRTWRADAAALLGGNYDAQLKGSKSGVPELPMAWPIGAAITDRSVYVLDIYSRRVLRADFVFAAEEVCDVK